MKLTSTKMPKYHVSYFNQNKWKGSIAVGFELCNSLSFWYPNQKEKEGPKGTQRVPTPKSMLAFETPNVKILF